MKNNNVRYLIKSFLLIIGVSLLFWNCERENLINLGESSSVVEVVLIKEIFNKKFSSEAYPFLKTPLWEEGSESYFNGEKYFEIPFNELRKFNLDNSELLTSHNLIAKQTNEGYELSIVFFAITNDLGMEIVNFNLDNEEFKNGIIGFFDLKGNVQEMYKLKDGQRHKSNASIKLVDKNNSIEKDMPEPGECQEVVIDHYERTCWSKDTPNEWCSPWTVAYSYSYLDCGDSMGGSSYTESVSECTEVGYVKNDAGVCVPEILNELTGKLKCIFEKMDSVSEGFKAAIKKFDGKFPVNHLKLVGKNITDTTVNAQTHQPENYIVKIEINTNNLNRPNISIARTIIHEVIHAEMYRKLASLLKVGTLSDLTMDKLDSVVAIGSYSGITKYYNSYGYEGYQHEHMAGEYRTAISSYLKEIQPGLPAFDYLALAWEGLKETDAWFSDLTEDERTAIDKRLIAIDAQGGESCTE